MFVDDINIIFVDFTTNQSQYQNHYARQRTQIMLKMVMKVMKMKIYTVFSLRLKKK